MSNAIIEVEGLSKHYRLGSPPGVMEGLKNTFARLSGGPTDGEARSLWALKDVSFQVGQGEVLGIIGRNGAGKTTLLKLLSRITEPTGGRARIVGRVGSLLEVGTGFHPELTGRENILLNGSILGMSRREIRSKFDEIVAFSEIERFIDTPVKRYSSGMYTRLAFAVAAHLEPEILIVDEVLAVGDFAFQKKCLGKMSAMNRSGRTVLFVSHSMPSISSLCSRCLFIDAGRIRCDDRTDIAIQRYLDAVAPPASGGVKLSPPAGDVPVYITRIAAQNAAGEIAAKFDLGEPVWLGIEYVIARPVSSVTLAMLLSRNGVPLVYSYDTDVDEALRERREAGTYRVRLRLPCEHFKEGGYGVELKIGWNRVEISDPRATLAFEIMNHHCDLMHKSYRADRPGQCAYNLRWETARTG